MTFCSAEIKFCRLPLVIVFFFCRLVDFLEGSLGEKEGRFGPPEAAKKRQILGAAGAPETLFKLSGSTCRAPKAPFIELKQETQVTGVYSYT